MRPKVNIHKFLNRCLVSLSDRQQDVLLARYGLNNNRGGRITLAALGDKYGITRERVRQIEASALSVVRSMLQKDLESRQVIEAAAYHLRSVGGLERGDRFLDEQAILAAAESDKLFAPTFSFLFKANGFPMHYEEDEAHHAFWYTDKDIVKTAQNFIRKFEGLLKSKKEEIINSGKFEELFHRSVQAHGISETVGLNYLSVSKKFGTNPYRDIGLAEWPEIAPRTVRDRAYLVLKKIRRPLHFTDIALEINKVKFDHKKAYAQTVHNELIKDGRFVLVGRGMYGLVEHGYQAGTARDVIRRVLKQKGPLSAQDVVLVLQEERFFKPNTILLNLQNKNVFERLPDGKYRVKEV